jgi:phage-related minor tail protein
MENKQDNAKLQDDVLHFEQHSTLSAEEVAKAVQRHNRKHKEDSQKATQPATARSKSR